MSVLDKTGGDCSWATADVEDVVSFFDVGDEECGVGFCGA